MSIDVGSGSMDGERMRGRGSDAVPEIRERMNSPLEKREVRLRGLWALSPARSGGFR
jgi:hypothetical protein